VLIPLIEKIRLPLWGSLSYIPRRGRRGFSLGFSAQGGNIMKIWNKPQVREQEVGLEVTSYLPAEIDII
jgi:coenzyme PQQ precursor peptide PqqA